MNDKTRSWLLVVGSFIIIIIIMLIGVQMRKGTGIQIRANLGYAIGIYQYTVSGGNPGSSINVWFTFEVNGGKLVRMYTKGKTTGSTKATEGNKYLVIYDTTNPENCQILFDYPIKDSTDFIRYLEEFKTKPLDFDKYF